MDYSVLFTNLPTLETERLQLRPFRMEDAEDVITWASDPEVWVHTTVEPPASIEDSYGRITRQLEQYAEGKVASFAVVLKETGRVIGEVLAMPLPRIGSISVGYDLGKPYWNCGYATEATKAAVGYCFHALGVNRVEAMCYPANAASFGVMRKVGMVCECTLRRYACIKGHFRDLAVCSILRQEWSGEPGSIPQIVPSRRGQVGGEITDLFNHFPVLETGRLRLRRVQWEDANDMFEYASDPEVVQYVTFQAHRTLDDTYVQLDRMLTRPPGSGLMTLAIEHRETGKMLGTCGIFLDSESDARAEIAYVLNKRFWGQGYVTEAVMTVIAYGFRALRLNRIQALCFPENVASYRVMEKAGMTYEGTLRQYMLIKGAYRDLKIYSILRDEWQQRSA